MSLIADAREVLLALIAHSGENLLHGMWSDSEYLACMHHSGLAAEIRLSSKSGSEHDPFEHLSLLTAKPPGLKHLIKPKSTF